MRMLIAAVTALLVVVPAAEAQQHPTPPPAMSDKQKAAIAEKKARDKDIDEAYQATIKKMPDADKKTMDPWGNLRATPAR